MNEATKNKTKTKKKKSPTTKIQHAHKAIASLPSVNEFYLLFSVSVWFLLRVAFFFFFTSTLFVFSSCQLFNLNIIIKSMCIFSFADIIFVVVAVVAVDFAFCLAFWWSFTIENGGRVYINAIDSYSFILNRCFKPFKLTVLFLCSFFCFFVNAIPVIFSVNQTIVYGVFVQRLCTQVI